MTKFDGQSHFLRGIDSFFNRYFMRNTRNFRVLAKKNLSLASGNVFKKFNFQNFPNFPDFQFERGFNRKNYREQFVPTVPTVFAVPTH